MAKPSKWHSRLRSFAADAAKRLLEEVTLPEEASVLQDVSCEYLWVFHIPFNKKIGGEASRMCCAQQNNGNM